MGFTCPRCNNMSKKFIGLNKEKMYCRKCLKLKGKEVNKSFNIAEGEYTLDYDLTIEQKKASEFILNSVINNHTCALNAVCGAGKTEIIYPVIKYCLHNNKKVGIAIPRKDVVIELVERIKKDFNVSVLGVYGGNSEIIEADIIVFTTHQAYRYNNYFDVLIIDEVDAFPYKDNTTLQNVVKKCSKLFVYLSATMPSYIKKDRSIKSYYLNRRYHGHRIPVPRYKICFSYLRGLKRILKKYKEKVVLVYFPTIRIQNKISKKVKHDYLVNSSSENRKDILRQIKAMNKGIVFTTTVLERGITIKDVQIIVYNADHKLFDKDTLIQIAGRAGRHKDCYTGDVIFLCKNKTRSVLRCIRSIKKCNA